MVSIQHVSAVRGSSTVLKDASLDINPKDIVCLIGESGSGKTTLLKLLTRELDPVNGVVKIDGAILSQFPREVLRLYRAQLGILSQADTLDPALTIEGNIRLPLDRTGTAKAERDRAVSDLLKRLGLASCAALRPAQVSTGERQLARFAMAIAANPMILLLDEPFSGLSEDRAKTMANMLQQMNKKGTTMLIASSDRRTATYFVQPRIAILEKGKIAEEQQMTVPEPRRKRVQQMAEDAMTTLIEGTRDVPVTTDTPVAHEEEQGKKKIRITAVGSL